MLEFLFYGLLALCKFFYLNMLGLFLIHAMLVKVSHFNRYDDRGRLRGAGDST